MVAPCKSDDRTCSTIYPRRIAQVLTRTSPSARLPNPVPNGVACSVGSNPPGVINLRNSSGMLFNWEVVGVEKLIP